MSVNIIRQHGGVNIMDLQEVTQRIEELDMLLRDCPDMPTDHPLRREYRALMALLEQSPREATGQV